MHEKRYSVNKGSLKEAEIDGAVQALQALRCGKTRAESHCRCGHCSDCNASSQHACNRLNPEERCASKAKQVACLRSRQHAYTDRDILTNEKISMQYPSGNEIYMNRDKQMDAHIHAQDNIPFNMP